MTCPNVRVHVSYEVILVAMGNGGEKVPVGMVQIMDIPLLAINIKSLQSLPLQYCLHPIA